MMTVAGLWLIRKSKNHSGATRRPIQKWVMTEFKLLKIGSNDAKPFRGYDALRKEIRRADHESGLNRGFGTHSFRRGSACHMAKAGATTPQIRMAGGWKTDAMVAIYTDDSPYKTDALDQGFAQAVGYE